MVYKKTLENFRADTVPSGLFLFIPLSPNETSRSEPVAFHTDFLE